MCDEIRTIDWSVTEQPGVVIGSIGRPWDRTVRQTRGTVETELRIRMRSGDTYEATGDEAVTVLLILRPWES